MNNLVMFPTTIEVATAITILTSLLARRFLCLPIHIRKAALTLFAILVLFYRVAVQVVV